MMKPWIIGINGIAVEIRSDGPFSAKPASDVPDCYWYVAGPDGRRNVAAFPGGAVLCSRELAERVAEAANQLIGPAEPQSAT